MTARDSHAAAIVKATQQRKLTQSIQTLMGICSGLVADGALHDREITFLSTWLKENSEASTAWPGNEIYRHVRAIVADGIVTTEERDHLLDVLQKLTGTYFAHTGASAPEGPALPIDDDPSVFFRNMTFCFTGTFLYGTRAACERAILSLGGMAVDSISKKLNYLVIGALIEPTWAHTTFGRKIEKAVQYRADGNELAIVSERQWTAALADTGRATAP